MMGADFGPIRTVRVHKEQYDAIESKADIVIITCIEDGRCVSFKRKREDLISTEDSTNDHKKEELWSWNELNNENWSHGTFSSKEEAIQDALSDLRDIQRTLCTSFPTIFVGQCEYIPLRTDLDPDKCMEYLDELYCDDSGCDYYIYEGVSDEQRKWLANKLSDLMVEFHKMIGLKPNWFRVLTTEEIDLIDYQQCKDEYTNNNSSPFELTELEWDILRLCIKHGSGDTKLSQSSHFQNKVTVETKDLTLREFAARAKLDNGTLWIDHSAIPEGGN